MKSTPKSAVIALYRALLREARKLPDPLVGHLQAANAGDKLATVRTLRFAYGVSGPLRQQNLTAFKRSGSPPKPGDARPPSFPPALRALLASPLARMKQNARVQPDEPVALSFALDRRGWLGKLPERRERNIWWNWWREEPTKALAATEIKVIEGAANETVQLPPELVDGAGKPEECTIEGSNSSTSLRLRQLGLPVAKTQRAGLIQRAEEYASYRIVPNAPRRSSERIFDANEQDMNKKPEPIRPIPPQSRFIRRRYRDLLSKMPLLTFKPTSPSGVSAVPPLETTTKDLHPPLLTPTISGKFDVSISSLATIPGSRNRTTYSLVRQEDREWVERAQQAKGPASPKKPKVHSEDT